MTLITNEIYMLDGFRRTLLVFAADRRITFPDGTHVARRKLFPIRYLDAGISYFGLAEVFPAGKKRYLADWLDNFIRNHSGIKTLKAFAFQLRDDLHTVAPPAVLSTNASGFHICGYNAQGLPEFWYLSNIGGMDAFA